MVLAATLLFFQSFAEHIFGFAVYLVVDAVLVFQFGTVPVVLGHVNSWYLVEYVLWHVEVEYLVALAVALQIDSTSWRVKGLLVLALMFLLMRAVMSGYLYLVAVRWFVGVYLLLDCLVHYL